MVRFFLRLGLGGNRFRHGYSTWDEAMAVCTGYDAKAITETVLRASRLVRDGDFQYERDGVVFDQIQYSWPLVAALLGTPRKDNLLHVLDWGGSLGSTYRQNSELLAAAGLKIKWTVLEQKHLSQIGSEEFQTEELNFVSEIEELEKNTFDVILFASSICYFESPSRALEKAVSLNPNRIILDRTPESKSQRDLIGVQRVGKGIYKASFPIHSFAKGSLATMIGSPYVQLSEWVSDLQPDPQTIAKGYVFQK